MPGHGFPDDGRGTKFVASLDQPSLRWEPAESAGCEPGPLGKGLAPLGGLGLHGWCWDEPPRKIEQNRKFSSELMKF